MHSINGEERKLAGGMLVMMRAADLHGFVANAEGMVVYNIAIRPDILAAIQRKHFRSDDMFWGGSLNPLPRHYALGTEQRRLMGDSFEELSHGSFDEFHTERFLLNVLHTIYLKPRSATAGYLEKYPNMSDWLAQALAEWSQKPDNLFSGTSALARLAGRSPEHVSRVLRECTGRTPTDWLNEARMHQATKQLEVTNRKVLDIALDCGFDSLGHFYSVFNKTHGCPPRAYRRRCQPRPI